MAKMFTVTGTGKRPITINRDLKRPPRRKTILPITGKGKPGSRLAVKLPVQERPVRPVRRIKGVVSRIARGPKPIGIKPSLIPSAVPRPARKRWRETLRKPEGYVRVDPEASSALIECFIDVDDLTKSPYFLNRATEKSPDHDHEGECRHPRNASSFVSTLGLVILKAGRLGIYCGFWRPVNAAIVYIFSDDDDAVALFAEWRAAASKGKWLHAMVYSNPYIRIT